MKKLLLIGALLCVFCSSSLGNPKMNAAPANVHEGHEWVDLGLPSGLKWATCNIGASCPEEYGDYFAWGETRPKSEYTSSNCISYGESWGDIGGNSSRDAARANWGGNWRMPTKAELQELKDNCTWTWTTQNGHKGYKVTSKKNSQSIFLPAAGYRDADRLYGGGEDGYFWSSTPYEIITDFACDLYFIEGDRGVGWGYRDCGRSVRPVLDDSKMNAAPANVHEGHEWVDLGLPSGLKWATCNIGASCPEEYGDYFAWGETRPKSEYTSSNCISYGESWGDIGGNSSRDAARANWGGSWRMPTKAELQELKDNCTWTWTTQNGHQGYRVTGKNGQSIFLPAAGYRCWDRLYEDGEYGYYWSSTPGESPTDDAFNLYFYEDHRYVAWSGRYFGRSVRPVLEGFNSDAAGKIDELLNSSTTGTYKGHEWFDLGLSVKWATCNIGASCPVEYGDYFAWGETRPKSEYTSSNCISYGESWGDIGGDSSRDAARANWGGSWRMPTKAEFQELVDNCTWTWTTQNGHQGYRVTGKNGQSIFLPAAGFRGGGKLYYDGEGGYYWSSTPNESFADLACYLYFYEGDRSVNWDIRLGGISVRPVLDD